MAETTANRAPTGDDCDEPAEESVDVVVPSLAPGVELLGPYQGSGFREPRYLIRRGDGQVAQLPQLLYRTACLIDGRRDLLAVATLLADEFGDELDEEAADEQVAFLLERRLCPAGIVAPLPSHLANEHASGTAGDGTSSAPGRPAGGAEEGPGPTRRDHLLMLRLRKKVVPERVAWGIAGVFAPLFHPLAVLALMACFIAVDVTLFAGPGWSGLAAGGRAVIGTPALTLAVLGVIAVTGVFHESGHVAACRYGGAVPGSMGVGVYLIWPAFYSDVTDVYRLSRRGRLRTDLAGVYFNAIALIALGAAYLTTGSSWLLVAVAMLHLETAWQFLPSLRLDGYYVLADLVGVPDLFARIRPILAGIARPRRTPPAAVRELKPWVRWTVTGWVLFVIPFLGYWVVLFVVLAPQLAPSAWSALRGLLVTAAGAAADLRPAAVVLAAVQIVLLVLPWVGGTIVAARLARRLVRKPLRRAHAGVTRVRSRRRNRARAQPVRRPDRVNP